MGPGNEVRQLRRLLPAGLALVAVDPAEADHASLHPVERALGSCLVPARRRDLLGGRIAARACLDELGVDAGPLRVRDDGAPAWPDAVRGSIAHTAGICLAVVGGSRCVSGVGVDVEPVGATPAVVHALVLTDAEREGSPDGTLDPAKGRLAFCAKEAYYKWCRSAGHTSRLDFHDVEVGLRGGRLSFSPKNRVTSGLGPTVPAPTGAFVVGTTWVVAVVWSRVS